MLLTDISVQQDLINHQHLPIRGHKYRFANRAFFILLSSNQDATMSINIIDLGVWVLK